jgi:diazepam-binding inhibitor (GABA receptor modulator, acyl-CoA-binding protein)
MADALETRFQDAAESVQDLPERPDNATLLRLYALYKQATAGDVEGKRPGMMDFSGRAKYDAWAEVEGTPREDAMEQYIGLVERLRDA